MQLNPMHLKVAGLMNGRLFRIPEYQRGYAWGTRQREDLFGDILDVQRSGREHFMATVVALAKDTRVIGADEYKTAELVDGQQRVTTLVILFKAIEKQLDPNETSQAKVKREIGELLVKGDDHSLILLQTNHDSSNIFTNYIRNGKIDRSSVKTAADMNLVNAAHECEEFVSSWKESRPVIELVGIVRNKLSMIYHELADEATVYRVFEVLNSRGLDVKWIDKLKSQLMALIFEHVPEGTRAETVREMQVIWQDIYRTLGLRGELGDEALRFAGTWALGSRPNRIISQEDAAAGLARAAGTKLKSIVGVGEQLKEVVIAVHQLDDDVRLRAVSRIAHARFVATAILLRGFEQKTRSELLGKWERVTFRVFGLGGADTRHKVGDYVRLGYDIIKSPLKPQQILLRLDELGSDYDIHEIVAAPNFWLHCYDGWTEELRYLLYRYDEHLSKTSGENLNNSQWNKVWTQDPSRSVEHIKPQSSGVDYVHHIGNLTMLPPNVNSSLKDKPPQEKAPTYKSCGLKATAAVGELIESGTKWNRQAVLDRAADIEAFVLKEWAN